MTIAWIVMNAVGIYVIDKMFVLPAVEVWAESKESTSEGRSDRASAISQEALAAVYSDTEKAKLVSAMPGFDILDTSPTKVKRLSAWLSAGGACIVCRTPQGADTYKTDSTQEDLTVLCPGCAEKLQAQRIGAELPNGSISSQIRRLFGRAETPNSIGGRTPAMEAARLELEKRSKSSTRPGH